MPRSTILMFAMILSLPATVSGQRSTQGSGGGQWRASWVVFADTIDKFRKATADFPSPSFQMLLRGQELPDSFSVKQRFGGQVTWEGTFAGVLTKDSEGASLLEGHVYKLDVKMPDVTKQGFILHVYPRAADIEKWKAAPAGPSVRFSAQLKGIAGFQTSEMVAKDAVVYYLLLVDAVPVLK